MPMISILLYIVLVPCVFTVLSNAICIVGSVILL